MKSFIEAGGRARWDFLVFDFNEQKVDEARKLSEEWGFEKSQRNRSFITGHVTKKKTNI